MASELVEKTAKMVEEKFRHEGTGHDWEHIRRVWQMSQKIAAEEPTADTETVELAALLHDIADWKEQDGDITAGPREAEKWLKEQHADPARIAHVCDIIGHMSFKGARGKDAMTTLEGKIVQDADRLDGLGAIGVIRAIAYGAAKNRILHDPRFKPKVNMTQEEHMRRTLDPKDDTTINHFHEKLLLLKDRMNTLPAKRIAHARHEFIVEFLDRFYREWDGELESAPQNRNAEIELERTYLAKELPVDLHAHPRKEMLDIYVPDGTGHATLRVRKNGDRHEITRKKPHPTNPTEMTEETIPLTATEFQSLAQMTGLRVHKTRYQYPYNGQICEIDVFRDTLSGLVLVDFEFKTQNEMKQFTKPPFCLAEVTDAEFIAGGKLCGKKYQDLEEELLRFGYRPLAIEETA